MELIPGGAAGDFLAFLHKGKVAVLSPKLLLMLFHVHEVALNQLVQDNVCQGPAYLPLNRLWIVLPPRLHVMLCEFISVPCVSKIQGSTVVGLIFQVPSCPWQH